MNNEKRVHRVGTVTFGCCLIVFGVLFLIRLFEPTFSIEFVCRLWPCMFILLGVEILMTNAKKAAEFVYDKAAIFLMILLLGFAMCMALAEKMMEYEYMYLG